MSERKKLSLKLKISSILATLICAGVFCIFAYLSFFYPKGLVSDSTYEVFRIVRASYELEENGIIEIPEDKMNVLQQYICENAPEDESNGFSLEVMNDWTFLGKFYIEVSPFRDVSFNSECHQTVKVSSRSGNADVVTGVLSSDSKYNRFAGCSAGYSLLFGKNQITKWRFGEMISTIECPIENPIFFTATSLGDTFYIEDGNSTLGYIMDDTYYPIADDYASFIEHPFVTIRNWVFYINNDLDLIRFDKSTAEKKVMAHKVFKISTTNGNLCFFDGEEHYINCAFDGSKG